MKSKSVNKVTVLADVVIPKVVLSVFTYWAVILAVKYSSQIKPINL